MLSILIVTSEGEAGALPAPDPSIEILQARGAEQALEKLGRNRRIDAVLLAAGGQNADIARAIREDNPAPPPLFAAATEDAPITGVRMLGSDRLPDAFDRLLAELS